MRFITRLPLLLILFCASSFYAKGITASFTADVTAGCAPLVVNFTNTSTGGTSYFWDFGTGTTSVLKDASTSFTIPGTYVVKMTVYGPGGPVTSTMTITVYPKPAVSFTASATSICPGTTVVFTSTTIGGVPGPVTYLWAFGDGNTSTLSTPSDTYYAPGDYNITLAARNADGCDSTLTVPKFIHVNTPPKANFSVNSTYFCKIPGHAIFTNLVTGTPGFTYAWDFGDGGTSTAPNPIHDYLALGTYTVKLVVTDGNGCMDSIIRPAYITLGTFTASFTYPTTACANSTVIFTNTSSSHISSSWTYGDGGTGTGDPGSHVYTTPGTYTVTLVVYNGTCYDTISHTITIIAGPKISFTQAPLQPCPPPVAITFTGTVPSGSVVSWDFGDGGTGFGGAPTHTYGSAGVYTVTMTCTDPVTGCVSTAKRVDTLYDMDFGITATPRYGCKPLTVSFAYHAYTSEPPPGSHPYPYPITSYSWTFGDGGTGTVGTTSHTYTNVGVYTARLTITTANGCTFTDTENIAVGAPPVVTFSATPTHVCYGEPVTYVATVISGPVDDYVWSFGDFYLGVCGTKHDSLPTAIYTDTIPGVFTVTLTPSYHGCKGTPVVMPLYITVDSPRAMATCTVLCTPPGRVVFSDSSMGDDSRLWIFGDGTTSTARNPIHDYTTFTSYTVILATLNTKSGCRDTTKLSFNLSFPTPSFTADKTTICADGYVKLTGTITGGTSTSYLWYGGGTFEGGGTTGTKWPVITDTFHTSGLYSISLVVSDANGCLDTFTRPNYITVVQPIVKFTATPTKGCWPLTVTFTDASTDVFGYTIVGHSWAFGDGGTASGPGLSFTHTFVTAGTFATTEVVTDNLGCKATLTQNLVTVWRPHADFSVYKYPCVGDSVQFVNLTSGAVSYLWTFGDGSTSTGFSPWHTYTAPGLYTVSLAVVDANGCKDTATFVNYINATQVIASFYMDDSFSICPPLLTHFFNTSTGATKYAWDLGDGSTSSAINPSDLYILVNYYTVTLIATNAYGCYSTAYGYPSIFGYSGGLTYTPLTGCAPLLVHFKAKIENVPSIVWDFSDGSTSKTSFSDTTDHVYVLPGAYVPKLILSDNTGCQSSSTGLDTIKVDKVYPGFKTVPSPVCQNSPMYFKDTSRSYFSTITNWAWTFTNGDVSNVNAPTYIYSLAGTYPVNLVVKDGWGCTDSVTESVTVMPPPVITACPDTVICVSDAATLYASGGVSYTWSPSSLVTCSNCNPTKTSPSTVTTYTVTGTDQFNCSGTDTVMVSLKTKTTSHAFGDTEVCRGVVVQLHDSGATKYTWIPGTGLSSPNVADPYAAPDNTTKYMVIGKLASCEPDTNFVWLTIHQLPTVDAGPDQRLVEGSTAQLNATGTLIESYSWATDPTLSCDTCANPVASMSVTTTYKVHVTSSFGCKASDTVTIHIFCDKSQIFMPNAFTPNGDGQNDVYYPRGIGVSVIKSFRIYNRWGQLLFERSGIQINDAANAWDGSYLGNVPRPDVYVYVLDAICETGEPINIKGDVTIIR